MDTQTAAMLRELVAAAQVAEAAWNDADLKCCVIHGGIRDKANRAAERKARKAMNDARQAKYDACIAAGMAHGDAIFYR